MKHFDIEPRERLQIQYLTATPEDARAVDIGIQRFVSFVLILVALVTVLHFTVEPNIAVAMQIEPVRQNDYYCQQIRDGHVFTSIEGPVKELCAKWGVSL